MDLSKIISISQIVVSVLLVIGILLQQRGAGASAITGGAGGSTYYARRGFEKVLYIGIIVLATAFIALAVTSIFVDTKF